MSRDGGKAGEAASLLVGSAPDDSSSASRMSASTQMTPSTPSTPRNHASLLAPSPTKETLASVSQLFVYQLGLTLHVGYFCYTVLGNSNRNELYELLRIECPWSLLWETKLVPTDQASPYGEEREDIFAASWDPPSRGFSDSGGLHHLTSAVRIQFFKQSLSSPFLSSQPRALPKYLWGKSSRRN